MGKCHVSKTIDVSSIDRLIEDGVSYLSQLWQQPPRAQEAAPGRQKAPIGRSTRASRASLSCPEAMATGVKKRSFYSKLLSGEISINSCCGADLGAAVADLKNLSYNQLIHLFLRISTSGRTKSFGAATDQAHIYFRQNVERLLFERLVQQIQLGHQSHVNAINFTSSSIHPTAAANGGQVLPPCASTRSQTQHRLQDEQAAISSLVRNCQCPEVGKQIFLTLGLIKTLSSLGKPELQHRYPWRIPLPMTTGPGGAATTGSTPTTPLVKKVLPADSKTSTLPAAPPSMLPHLRSRAALPSRTGRVEEIFIELPTLYLALKLRGKPSDKVYTHVIETALAGSQQLRVEILTYSGGEFNYVGVTDSAGRCIKELKHVLSQKKSGGGGRLLKSVSSTRSSQSHCSGVSDILVKARANLKKRRQDAPDQENTHPVRALSPPKDSRGRTPSEIRLALEAQASRQQSAGLTPRFANCRLSPDQRLTSGYRQCAQKARSLREEAFGKTGKPGDHLACLRGCHLPTISSNDVRAVDSTTGGNGVAVNARVLSSGQLVSSGGCLELAGSCEGEIAGRFHTALTSVPTSYRTASSQPQAADSRESPPSFCLSRVGSQEVDQDESCGERIRRSDLYVVKRRDF